MAAPTTLAVASAVIAGPIFGKRPSLSNRFARRETPIRVPIVSNMFTNIRAKMRSHVVAMFSMGYIRSMAKNVELMLSGMPKNESVC